MARVRIWKGNFSLRNRIIRVSTFSVKITSPIMLLALRTILDSCPCKVVLLVWLTEIFETMACDMFIILLFKNYSVLVCYDYVHIQMYISLYASLRIWIQRMTIFVNEQCEVWRLCDVFDKEVCGLYKNIIPRIRVNGSSIIQSTNKEPSYFLSFDVTSQKKKLYNIMVK